MNFRNWSDVGNFPGVREFTSSHAFVEEFGQPFRHNATSYFQKFGWNVIGRTIRFHWFLMRSWISYASVGFRNNEFFEFICLMKCLKVVGDGFIFVERDFPTSEKKLFKSSHCFWHSESSKACYFVEICFLLQLFHWQASIFFISWWHFWKACLYNFVWRFRG